MKRLYPVLLTIGSALFPGSSNGGPVVYSMPFEGKVATEYNVECDNGNSKHCIFPIEMEGSGWAQEIDFWGTKRELNKLKRKIHQGDYIRIEPGIGDGSPHYFPDDVTEINHKKVGKHLKVIEFEGLDFP